MYFQGQSSLTHVHVASHTGSEKSLEIYPCTFCPKKFKWITSLKSHLARHTNDGYHCAHCGKGFYLKKDLDRHVLIHTGERPFACCICGKRYQRNFQLKMHIYRDHSSTLSWWTAKCWGVGVGGGDKLQAAHGTLPLLFGFACHVLRPTWNPNNCHLQKMVEHLLNMPYDECCTSRIKGKL
jgi:hypothetical protein